MTASATPDLFGAVPPPWGPEVGQPAWFEGEKFVVRDIHNGFAWAADMDGDMYSIPTVDLREPPKGGEA